MDFESNNARMLAQRQDSPVAEMLVQGDKRAALVNNSSHNLRIISASLTHIFGADDIMPLFSQDVGQFAPKHLVQIKAHDSPRDSFREFSVFNRCRGILQGSAYVVFGEFRISPHNVLPGLPFGKVRHEHGNRDACAANHRLAAADARVDLDTIHMHIFVLSVEFHKDCLPPAPGFQAFPSTILISSRSSGLRGWLKGAIFTSRLPSVPSKKPSAFVRVTPICSQARLTASLC